MNIIISVPFGMIRPSKNKRYHYDYPKLHYMSQNRQTKRGEKYSSYKSVSRFLYTSWHVTIYISKISLIQRAGVRSTGAEKKARVYEYSKKHPKIELFKNLL